MASIIRMPEVLANETEASVQTWLVGVGDTVVVGQPIAEIETAKAMVEYSAEMEGTFLRALIEPGDSAEVGTPIAVIGSSSDSASDIDELLLREGAGASASGVVGPVSDGTAAPVADSSVAPRAVASPIVRRLAKTRAVDLSGITGTGPGGRIVRRDLDAAGAPASAAPVAAIALDAPAPVLTAHTSVIAAPAVAVLAATAAGPASSAPSTAIAGSREVPHTPMRRAIARRLTESKTTVPHFYVTADCRMDALLALRAQVNESTTRRVSVNDFIVKAVALALIDVPEANAIWGEKAMTVFDSVDLAIAVSTVGGLLTPVLRGVESMPLSTISSSIASLAERARGGRLTQVELEGGAFAISNLGMYGVDQFSAILNPPQAGILAVGAAKTRPIVVDGELAVGSVMSVTLSADHRVIDGAVAAEWIAAFVRRIEAPLQILI